MFKKMLVVSFVLFGGSQVCAQDAVQSALNEAAHLRVAEIRNRVVEPRYGLLFEAN